MPTLNTSLSRYLDYSDAVVLLFVAICGNFLKEMLGCKIQHLLTDHRVAKYCIVYLTILLAVNKTADHTTSPVRAIQMSVVIALLFFFFIRMPPIPTFVVVLLVTALHMTHVYSKRNQHSEGSGGDTNTTSGEDGTENGQPSSTTHLFQVVLGLSVAVTLVVGNVMRFRDKKAHYGDAFSHVEYWFDVGTCKRTREGTFTKACHR